MQNNDCAPLWFRWEATQKTCPDFIGHWDAVTSEFWRFLYFSSITEPTIFDCWWCSNRMADLFYSLRFCLWCSRSKFWKTSIFSAVLWLGSRFTNIDLSRIGWIQFLRVDVVGWGPFWFVGLADPCRVSLYQDFMWNFLSWRLLVESPPVVILVFFPFMKTPRL